MTFQQILLALRARYKLALIIAALTMIAAVATALILPPKYKATTTLVLEFKSVDPITGAFMPVQLLMSSYMATEVDILESQAVALKVVDALKMTDNPRVHEKFLETTEGKGRFEDWLARGLRSKLEVKPSKESRLLDVNFTNPDPEFAAKVANAFADAYIQLNLDMKTSPARDSATWFDAQIKQLRDQLETAQARLSRYQSEKGITSSEQKYDVESTKLTELSTQLVQAQSQGYENATRQAQLEEFIAKGRNAESLPEVLASPVIQDLKSKLSIAETKLKQASNSLGVNHPEYQRAQTEVDTVRSKLLYEVKNVASVIGNNLRIAQGRERELRAAVAAQKAKLLDLNRNRDEFGVLSRDVENAQRAYDSAQQRHTQTSLESRVDKSNATVLVPAVPPDRPSFPNWKIVIALAAGMGVLLGVGFAIVAELLDRRVRGRDDMSALAGVPVWGMLESTMAVTRMVERTSRRSLKRKSYLKSLEEPRLGHTT